MSDRLEAGSKIYKTPLNLSHWFVALLSPAARQMTRKIDRVKVSGCPVAMEIFTVDLMNPVPQWGKAIVTRDGHQVRRVGENWREWERVGESTRSHVHSTVPPCLSCRRAMIYDACWVIW
jgi:hypothetical protein